MNKAQTLIKRIQNINESLKKKSINESTIDNELKQLYDGNLNNLLKHSYYQVTINSGGSRKLLVLYSNFGASNSLPTTSTIGDSKANIIKRSKVNFNIDLDRFEMMFEPLKVNSLNDIKDALNSCEDAIHIDNNGNILGVISGLSTI